MQKNLTLTIDEDLLRAARKRALDCDTSVNEVVRQFLGHFVEEKDTEKATSAVLKELQEIFRTSRFRIGKNKWTRDELHERR